MHLRDDVLEVGSIVCDGAAAHLPVLNIEQDADCQRRLQEKRAILANQDGPKQDMRTNAISLSAGNGD